MFWEKCQKYQNLQERSLVLTLLTCLNVSNYRGGLVMRFIMATFEKDAPLGVFSEFFMRDKKNGIDRPSAYATGDKH